MKKSVPWVAVWLIFSVITIAVAMLYQSAAVVDGQYIPVGNDSFYHARRIIDAAVGSRGFYQFDELIHVPEGSWLNWPWAYDFLLAQALRVALWIRPDMQPMQFLAYVPVAWVLVNLGLLTLIAREAGLGVVPAAIGLLVFSLLPLTQNLHGLGLIDHHFIELTFVLATVYFGLRFFGSPGRSRAIAIGAVLGSAVAFHNGLFLLQLPVLTCLLLLWLRGRTLPAQPLRWLAAGLLGTTLLVVLPSAPFRDLQFEFWALSWFHLYVAFGSALVISFTTWQPASRTTAGILAAIGITMLAPLIAKLSIGAAFVSGDLDIISHISEVQRPLARLLQAGGFSHVANLYSLLLFTAPVLLAIHVVALFKRQDNAQTWLSTMVLFGLALMLMQYRLHPFGSWALIIAGLLAIETLKQWLKWSRLITTAVAVVVVGIALQPPLKNQLFERAPPGLDRDYAASHSIFASLAAACAAQPGAVLSYGDDGHPIRYHTDCGVLTNNFLITPQHRRKMAEAGEYLAMTPRQFVDAAPHLRYVLVRMVQLFEHTADGLRSRTASEVAARNAPLFVALTFDDNLPSEYRLVDELRLDDERTFPYIRVFEIVRE